MKLDNHNLLCAFAVFMLAGVAGFALTGGRAGADLLGSDCDKRIVEVRVQG
jgi:hypothetical protein